MILSTLSCINLDVWLHVFFLPFRLHGQTRNTTFLTEESYFDLCKTINDAEVYLLTLFSQNVIGEGNGSNPITYKQSKFELHKTPGV